MLSLHPNFEVMNVTLIIHGNLLIIPKIRKVYYNLKEIHNVLFIDSIPSVSSVIPSLSLSDDNFPVVEY